MIASIDGRWLASKSRKAWHEIGHVAVAFYLGGKTLGCELGEDGVDARIIPGKNHRPPRTPDEWLAGVAYSFGGRAAVRWAIENGRLPAAPGAEPNPGDHGFFGEGGSSDHAQAWLDADRVPGWERRYAYDEGFERARMHLAANIAKIEPLVATLIARGAVSADEVGGTRLKLLSPQRARRGVAIPVEPRRAHLDGHGSLSTPWEVAVQRAGRHRAGIGLGPSSGLTTGGSTGASSCRPCDGRRPPIHFPISRSSRRSQPQERGVLGGHRRRRPRAPRLLIRPMRTLDIGKSYGP